MRINRPRPAAILLLVGLLTSAGGFLRESRAAQEILLDRVLADVNGEVITLSTLASRVVRMEREMRGYLSPAEFSKQAANLRAQVLRQMIDEMLVAQAGKAAGIEVTSAEIERSMANIKSENNITSEQQFGYLLQTQGFTYDEYRDFVERQVLIFKARRRLLGEVEITEEEVRQYYQEHEADFRLPDMVHLRHILYRLPEDASAQEEEFVRRRAERTLQDLRSGVDFAALAARVSEDPSAQNGGDIGTVARGQMLPEFEAVVFGLEAGQVSEPVRTKYGYHLIQAVELNIGVVQSLDAVRDKLRELLQERQMQVKQEQWLVDLRKKAFVKVMEHARPAASTP